MMDTSKNLLRVALSAERPEGSQEAATAAPVDRHCHRLRWIFGFILLKPKLMQIMHCVTTDCNCGNPS